MAAMVKITETFKLVSIGIFIPNSGKTVAVKIIETIHPTNILANVSINDNFLVCIDIIVFAFFSI